MSKTYNELSTQLNELFGLFGKKKPATGGTGSSGSTTSSANLDPDVDPTSVKTGFLHHAGKAIKQGIKGAAFDAVAGVLGSIPGVGNILYKSMHAGKETQQVASGTKEGLSKFAPQFAKIRASMSGQQKEIDAYDAANPAPDESTDPRAYNAWAKARNAALKPYLSRMSVLQKERNGLLSTVHNAARGNITGDTEADLEGILHRVLRRR